MDLQLTVIPTYTAKKYGRCSMLTDDEWKQVEQQHPRVTFRAMWETISRVMHAEKRPFYTSNVDFRNAYYHWKRNQ